MQLNLAKTILVTGHYGSGKTNLALNLAMDYRRQGREVILSDLDIVNPYFRTADFGEVAKASGIELIASDYAGSSLDIPALTGRLDAKLNSDATLIIDVGGDDAGAMALGRYAPRILQGEYSMLYVVSAYRYLMKAPADSAILLREIETAARMRATHVVNCSNLGTETTAADVERSMDYGRQVAALVELPLAFTAVNRQIAAEITGNQDIYPVDIFVTAPWNKAL